jgi:SAM-dependent methyltransferase
MGLRPNARPGSVAEHQPGDRHVPTQAETSQSASAPFPVNQVSNKTNSNRHPEYILAVKALFAGNPAPKVLSFGCSYGYECVDIATLWPEAEVFGCDINDGIIEKNKRRLGDQGITFFYSSAENLEAHGPFDAVFAMNVLCLHPDTKGVADISQIYPFANFAVLVRAIDKVLKRGGVLTTFNSNYMVDDVEETKGYTAATGPMYLGPLNKHSPDGTVATRAVISEEPAGHKTLYEWIDPTNGGRNISTPVWRKPG